MTPESIKKCFKAPLGKHAAIMFLRSGIVGARRGDWAEHELAELTRLIRNGAKLDELASYFPLRSRSTVATTASAIRRGLR